MLRRMMAPNAAGPDVDRVIDIVGLMKPETFRAAVHAITSFDGRDVLPRIAVPVLAIAGRHDRLAAPPEVMEKMAARIAQAEYACLEGSGHFAWAEEPDAFNALLLDFLARRVAA
jgi:pimeloyl-ACP methyl ester carboxylesterase